MAPNSLLGSRCTWCSFSGLLALLALESLIIHCQNDFRSVLGWWLTFCKSGKRCSFLDTALSSLHAWYGRTWGFQRFVLSHACLQDRRGSLIWGFQWCIYVCLLLRCSCRLGICHSGMIFRGRRLGIFRTCRNGKPPFWNVHHHKGYRHHRNMRQIISHSFHNSVKAFEYDHSLNT